MDTSIRDRTTRGAFAAAIVVAHVLLAYFLTQSRITHTTPAPGEGVSVFLPLAGETREAEPVAVEIRPQMEDPPEPITADRPDVQVRDPDDASASRLAKLSPAQIGAGRPDQPWANVSETGISILRRVLPAYPEESMRAGEQGGAVLQVLVDEGGNASEIRVARSSGFQRLDDSAVRAVRQWKFSPAVEGTTAVAAWGEMELRFNLYRFTVSRIIDVPLDLVPPGGILTAANDTPVTGGEAALQILMSEIGFGDGNGEWPPVEAKRLQGALAGWGDIQKVRFAGSAAGNRWRAYEVKPEFRRGGARETVELRWDIYQVWHARGGTSEWRIAIDRDGRIWCAHAGSAQARWQLSSSGG
jgi:periplasmic protein TonB